MSNAQKTPFISTLSGMMSDVNRSQAALKGRELPCHVVGVRGQIVTVQFDMLPEGINFPQITIPVATFPYIRYPIQAGDRGVTIAADVSLRGVSGLGPGIANLSYTLSLTPLFFVPIANAEWPGENPNKIVLYGPEGALIKTSDGKTSVSIDSDKIALSIAGQTLELSASGLIHNGVNIGATHKHNVNGVESGSSTVTTEVPK
ncbi:phage baseplate protein [Pantoea sp. JZ2]|uniref:phage baseplate protein n=1 Tax=Pantoea sp. JZ2 TaxID=2654189 RepID=UPI002B471334|nr:phage baseplate protein [Pantoea sp. JZ2]WRH13725.1 phage baseplate protein [Pantoea sp. JZ2]